MTGVLSWSSSGLLIEGQLLCALEPFCLEALSPVREVLRVIEVTTLAGVAALQWDLYCLPPHHQHPHPQAPGAGAQP